MLTSTKSNTGELQLYRRPSHDFFGNLRTRLLNLKYPELSDSARVTSSVAREKLYKKLTVNGQVTNLKELLTIFGNMEDQPWSIFSDAPDASERTINLGVFDFNKKTWTMWTSNPADNPPLLQLPLTFTDLISP